MAATTLVLGGCGGSNDGMNVVITDVDLTDTVDTTGGTLEDSGVRVVIPAGALGQSTTIRVQTVDEASLPLPLPAGLTAASSFIQVTADPNVSYFDEYVDVSIPFGGNGATLLHLQYDSYDETWEWEVLGWDGGELAGGVATAEAESPGFFVVVHQVNAPGVDVSALCDGLVSCRDPGEDDDDYTAAECEILLPVALTVYASYYESAGASAACVDALFDYYACLADSWQEEPVCDESGGYSSFPDFAACEAAAQAACPEL